MGVKSLIIDVESLDFEAESQIILTNSVFVDVVIGKVNPLNLKVKSLISKPLELD